MRRLFNSPAPMVKTSKSGLPTDTHGPADSHDILRLNALLRGIETDWRFVDANHRFTLNSLFSLIAGPSIGVLVFGGDGNFVAALVLVEVISIAFCDMLVVLLAAEVVGRQAEIRGRGLWASSMLRTLTRLPGNTYLMIEHTVKDRDWDARLKLNVIYFSMPVFFFGLFQFFRWKPETELIGMAALVFVVHVIQTILKARKAMAESPERVNLLPQTLSILFVAGVLTVCFAAVAFLWHSLGLQRGAVVPIYLISLALSAGVVFLINRHFAAERLKHLERFHSSPLAYWIERIGEDPSKIGLQSSRETRASSESRCA